MNKICSDNRLRATGEQPSFVLLLRGREQGKTTSVPPPPLALEKSSIEAHPELLPPRIVPAGTQRVLFHAVIVEFAPIASSLVLLLLQVQLRRRAESLSSH